MPPVLVKLVRALLRAGFTVKLGAVHDDSYHGIVFNPLDQPVGSIEYRSPLDEPAEYARGLSYAALHEDAVPDRAFRVAQRHVC